jgi:hypothetical protein
MSPPRLKASPAESMAALSATLQNTIIKKQKTEVPDRPPTKTYHLKAAIVLFDTVLALGALFGVTSQPLLRG